MVMRILVTGANGYIALWVVHTLLERGYFVRGTVRSEEKRSALLKLFKDSVLEGNFEVVLVPDMIVSGAYDEAVKGMDGIAHIASPTSLDFDTMNSSSQPVVRAMVGIFESALKYAGPQLKRIVATSTMSTTEEAAKNNLFDLATLDSGDKREEQEFTVYQMIAKYRPSKADAEKAAWKFVEDHKAEINWDLAVINPSATFGPILGEEPLGMSASMLYGVLKQQKLPALGCKHLWWTDVRDVALAHVRAFEVPEAGGNYFIMSSGTFDWQDWYDVANELNIPGYTFPKRDPSQLYDDEYPGVFNPTKARELLGINFKSKLETVKDSIRDFQARGW